MAKMIHQLVLPCKPPLKRTRFKLYLFTAFQCAVFRPNQYYSAAYRTHILRLTRTNLQMSHYYFRRYRQKFCQLSTVFTAIYKQLKIQMGVVPQCMFKIIYTAVKYDSFLSDTNFHIFWTSYDMLQPMNDFFADFCVSPNKNNSILQSLLFESLMQFDKTAHVLALTSDNNYTVILFLNLIDEGCFVKHLQDTNVSNRLLNSFTHFEQVLHFFFLFVDEKQHLLHPAMHFGGTAQHFPAHSLHNLQYVLKQQDFFCVLLQHKLRSFGNNVLQFVAETQYGWLVLSFFVLGETVNLQGQLFQFIVTANKVRVSTRRSQIMINAIVTPHSYPIIAECIQVAFHIRLMKFLQDKWNRASRVIIFQLEYSFRIVYQFRLTDQRYSLKLLIKYRLQLGGVLDQYHFVMILQNEVAFVIYAGQGDDYFSIKGRWQTVQIHYWGEDVVFWRRPLISIYLVRRSQNRSHYLQFQYQVSNLFSSNRRQPQPKSQQMVNTNFLSPIHIEMPFQIQAQFNNKQPYQIYVVKQNFTSKQIQNRTFC